MYSSVSAGVVHVLGACGVMSFSYLNLYPSCHTSFCRVFVLVLVLGLLFLVSCSFVLSFFCSFDLSFFRSFVLVLIVVVVVVVTPAAFFLNLVVVFSLFCLKFSEQKHRKYRCFEAQNHGIYDVFFSASGSIKYGIYSVCVPVPSKKTLVITQFLPCCKM